MVAHMYISILLVHICICVYLSKVFTNNFLSLPKKRINIVAPLVILIYFNTGACMRYLSERHLKNTTCVHTYIFTKYCQ